ncbi:MAG: methyltransferase domain-containing protein [Acidobacteria bacterium]|nr:methyltransferase domain-containing protein [Acidobacteriota bacterium]MBI3656656.1 methyltransferase domain-containing protein [Acidobacteriota bacterium]
MPIALNENPVLFAPTFHRINQGDLFVLIDPELPNWLATDGRGAKILTYIDGRRTFREIIEAYCQAYDVDLTKGWLHGHTFINGAYRAGFVFTTPLARAPYTGRAAVLKPDRLRELWIHLTNTCNLACAHCLVESAPDGLRGIRTEIWHRLIDEALALGVKRFYITGGEPFVRDDLFEIMAHMIEKVDELVVLTNAMLLKGERLKQLERFDRAKLKLQISLDGSRPEMNDPIRGQGTFAATVQGIRNVLDSGFLPTLTSSVMNGNADDIPEITRLAAHMGVKNHHLLWAHLRGRAAGDHKLSSPPPGRLVEIWKKTIQTAEALGIQVDNLESVKRRVLGKRGVKADLSNAAYDSLCVYADGHVYPSAATAGFKPLDMGSALESSLREVWLRSPIAETIRNVTVQRKAVCKDSYLKFFCGGGDLDHTYFYSAQSNGHGSFLAEDPFVELHDAMILDAMFTAARQRRALKTRSGFDSPVVYYAMGENALSYDEEDDRPPSAQGFEVNTLHSTCVLSFDLDRSRETVRQFYAEAAQQPQPELCCAGSYNGEETSHIPQEALDVAYGCGSPVGLADVKEGEVVVDLGSGGGIDCFIAAKLVGPSGRVVGIDMTDEMLEKALINKVKVAARLAYDVVEFKKGYLEEIPLPNKSADLIMSNCVLNLSPDKKRVFLEMWRVLKDHGRIAISDTVAADKLPDHMRANPRLWGECVSGALTEEEYLAYLEQSGFYGLSILKKSFWKEVEGHKFYSLVLRGYKFEKSAGCNFIGQKAIYRGPFKAVVDEEGHLFPRNEAVEVCTDTAAKLRRAPYELNFTVIGPDQPEEVFSIVTDACCAPGGSCC